MLKTRLKKSLGRLDTLKSLRTESGEIYKLWRLNQITDDALRAFCTFSNSHREILLAEVNRPARLEILSETKAAPVDYAGLSDNELAEAYAAQCGFVGTEH
jgi:hypothetical protein